LAFSFFFGKKRGRCSGSLKKFCTYLCECDNELKTAYFFFPFSNSKIHVFEAKKKRKSKVLFIIFIKRQKL
jgi:hypothetical protein